MYLLKYVYTYEGNSLHSGELINTKFGDFIKLKILLPLEGLYGIGIFQLKPKSVNLELL